MDTSVRGDVTAFLSRLDFEIILSILLTRKVLYTEACVHRFMHILNSSIHLYPVYLTSPVTYLRQCRISLSEN